LQNSKGLPVNGALLGLENDATEIFHSVCGKKSKFLRLRADYSRNLFFAWVRRFN